MTEKEKVIVVVGHYLPGLRSGGILRSLMSTVDTLSESHEFSIITRDRDVGSDRPYTGLRFNSWETSSNNRIMYVTTKGSRILNLVRVLNNCDANTIHLNSFFDFLCIKILIAKRLGLLIRKRIVLSPRGEFAWASLKQRYLRKYIYMKLAGAINLFRGIVWHASSEFEVGDIYRATGYQGLIIKVARDLPSLVKGVHINEVVDSPFRLRVVFLSRIAREKNLDLAIQIMSRIRSEVVFDIFGTISDKKYWEECAGLLERLPGNVVCTYRGSISPWEVHDIFSQYHLFLFPTGGENYGHVIAEALSVGTAVLTSNNTLWKNLEEKGVGWVIEVSDMDKYVEVIETLCACSKEHLQMLRLKVRSDSKDLIYNEEDVRDNRDLYAEIDE